jgi:hypothetical protein
MWVGGEIKRSECHPCSECHADADAVEEKCPKHCARVEKSIPCEGSGECSENGFCMTVPKRGGLSFCQPCAECHAGADAIENTCPDKCQGKQGGGHDDDL